MDFISTKEKWTDALIHYKNKFIISWIQSINDFDTVVQLDKFRNKNNGLTDVEELFFITIYSNPTLPDHKWLNSFTKNFGENNIINVYDNSELVRKLMLIYIEYSKNIQAIERVKSTYDFLKLSKINTLPENSEELYQIYLLLKKTSFFTYKGDVRGYDDLEMLYPYDNFSLLQKKYHIPKELENRLYSNDILIYLEAVQDLKKLEGDKNYEKIIKTKYLPRLAQDILKISEAYDYVMPNIIRQMILDKGIEYKDVILFDYPNIKDIQLFLQIGFLRQKLFKDSKEYHSYSNRDLTQINLKNMLSVFKEKINIIQDEGYVYFDVNEFIRHINSVFFWEDYQSFNCDKLLDSVSSSKRNFEEGKIYLFKRNLPQKLTVSNEPNEVELIINELSICNSVENYNILQEKLFNKYNSIINNIVADFLKKTPRPSEQKLSEEEIESKIKNIINDSVQRNNRFNTLLNNSKFSSIELSRGRVEKLVREDNEYLKTIIDKI